MSAWGEHVSTRPGVVSLAELSLIVAERTRFEQAGVPRIPSVAALKPSGRRARSHTYASGIMRTRPSSGPRVDQGGDRA